MQELIYVPFVLQVASTYARASCKYYYMYHSYHRLQVLTHVRMLHNPQTESRCVCVCVSSTQHPKKLGHNLSRGLSTGFFDHLLVVILPNKVTNSIRNALHSLLRRGARLMARLPRSAGNSHTKKILSALVPLPESHYREAF